MPISRAAVCLGRLLLAALWLTGLFLLAETGLQLSGRGEVAGIAYDELTGWRYGPRMSPNRLGFRGPEWRREKSPGVTRVMLVGDSYVAGAHYPYEETFPGRLSRLAPRFEFLTAAVSAWSTDQQLLFFEGEGAAFRPDVVMIFFTPNDTRESYAKGFLSGRRRDPGFPERQLWWLDNRFTLFHRLNERLENRPGSFAGIFRLYPVAFPTAAGPSTDRHLFLKDPPPEIEAAYRFEERLLSRFLRAVAAAGAKPVLSVIPTRLEFRELSRSPDHDVSLPRRFARRIAAGQGAGYLDLHGAFSGSPEGLYIAEEYHFNREGHRTAAAAVAAYLEGVSEN